MSLKKWFGKGPEGDWVRMGTDGKIKGPCAREPGEGKPKCLPRSKASSMSLKDRASAVRRKRREDPVADRKGKGGKPVNVSTHKEEFIVEKAKPTNPALWSRAKSAARAKFDVYPSAYANGWAVRWYKKRGGGWRTVKEETEIKPHKMYKDDKVVLAKNKADHDRLNKLGYTHDNPKTKKVEEACWDGYKQAGMKKKGKKVVPNCVPESESLGAMVARMQQKQQARDWNKKSQAEKLADLKKNREELKKRMEEGKNHTWKSEGHYTKDGKEWKGPQHAHDGQVMTGEKHTADSQNLYHFKALSPEVKKKVLEKMKMDEGIVDTIMKSKTLNKGNYSIAAKELQKKMKKDPSKSKIAHAHDVARYVKNVDARKLAAEEKVDEGAVYQALAAKPKKINWTADGKDADAEKKKKVPPKPQGAMKRKDFVKHLSNEVDMTGCPLLEKLSPSDGIGTYIKDFKKSDAPQFKGASASKRRKMAVAAYLGAKRKKMDEAMQYDSTMGVMDRGLPKGTEYMKDNTPGESTHECKSCEGRGCSDCNYRGSTDRKINVEAKEMSKKNPVAKNLNKFNKPATHRDRKNDYSRKDKHKGKVYEETEAGETKAEYRADNEINAPEAGIVPLTKDDIAHLYAEIDNMTDEQMDEYGFWDDCDCEDDCDCNEYESDVEWEDGPGDVEITEVLSVQGRLKRKFAARKNRQKLKVARNIAMRRGSDPARLKKRAVRGARSMVYKRLLKGRDKSAMPPAEKARFERLIGMYQPLVQRFAQRMLPKMRKMEINRMKSRRGGAQKAKKYKASKPITKASSQKAKKFKVKKR